ncbi:MAG: DUF1854 domain-containing protein [Limnochordales bacterium]|nr:DUF1854 domain-containing protein [Limnochordales bacterium]
MCIALFQELNLLDPRVSEFYRDTAAGLSLRVGHEEWKGVRVALAFPLTMRDRYIVVKDRDGKEIGIVKDLAELGEESQRVVREELAKAYFIPKITRINSIEEQFGITTWKVETDRGPRVFEVRERRDVRFIGPDHLIIKDVDGNRYEIVNLRQLDPASLSRLESQI